MKALTPGEAFAGTPPDPRFDKAYRFICMTAKTHMWNMTGVFERSSAINSGSFCGLHPLSWSRYSNEIDRLTRACAEPHAWQSLLIRIPQWSLVPLSGAFTQRKALTICTVGLSPETASRCASTVLITKYGPAHSHIFDNRFAAKVKQHLELPFSAAPCPVPPTPLSFLVFLSLWASAKWLRSDIFLLAFVILSR
jgi:hypothetical protein